jgi:hypothetical protein
LHSFLLLLPLLLSLLNPSLNVIANIANIVNTVNTENIVAAAIVKTALLPLTIPRAPTLLPLPNLAAGSSLI